MVHGHFESDGPVQPYLNAGGGTGGGGHTGRQINDQRDLHRLGYAGRGDVVLGDSEGHKWRQRELRHQHSVTSSLTNHRLPQYNSLKCAWPLERSSGAFMGSQELAATPFSTHHAL